MANVFDEALASIGAAVSDVREKVVEEGWFGRTVTDGPAGQAQDAPAPVESNAFDQSLEKLQESPAAAPERPRDAPEPGEGMER